MQDAIGQDADAVFRVRKKVRIDENNAKHNEVYITAPGIREAVFDGIVIMQSLVNGLLLCTYNRRGRQ